ncbi:MAG TPA: hypothetical protein EYQ43_02590 [Methyloprofundus sp.]|uniref:hypothetical protein n=1 Tax=Methyloprofundus sp. TaxID=2020875 RepID=UPI0017E2D0BA|nr:hypothetical protein [Methyloprofundus sp.]HIG64458.1 hypothetical protein [Methyloprofundus sp.]
MSTDFVAKLCAKDKAQLVGNSRSPWQELFRTLIYSQNREAGYTHSTGEKYDDHYIKHSSAYNVL